MSSHDLEADSLELAENHATVCRLLAEMANTVAHPSRLHAIRKQWDHNHAAYCFAMELCDGQRIP